MSRRHWCVGTIIGKSSGPQGVDWTQSQDEITLTPGAVRCIQGQLDLISDAYFLTEPQELVVLEMSTHLDLRRRRPGTQELIIGKGLWGLRVAEVNGRLTIGLRSEFQAAA